MRCSTLCYDDVGVSQGKELPKSIQIHKGQGWKIGVLGFGPVRQRLVVDVSQLVAVPSELKTLQAKVCDKLNETPSSSEGPHCFQKNFSMFVRSRLNRACSSIELSYFFYVYIRVRGCP